MTDIEAKNRLRRLELEAYSSVVCALRAQGSLDHEKRETLRLLCKQLSITEDRHKAEVRRAVNDEKLTTVADGIVGVDSSDSWVEEGRRITPVKTRVIPQKTLERLLGAGIANLAASLAVGSPSLPSRRFSQGKTTVSSSNVSSIPGVSSSSGGSPSALALAAAKLAQAANMVRGQDERQDENSQVAIKDERPIREMRVASLNSTFGRRRAQQQQQKRIGPGSRRGKRGSAVETPPVSSPAKVQKVVHCEAPATSVTSLSSKKVAPPPPPPPPPPLPSPSVITPVSSTGNLLAHSRALLASITKPSSLSSSSAPSSSPKQPITVLKQTKSLHSKPEQTPAPVAVAASAKATAVAMTPSPLSIRPLLSVSATKLNANALQLPAIVVTSGLQRNIYIVNTSMSQSGTTILMPKSSLTRSFPSVTSASASKAISSAPIVQTTMTRLSKAPVSSVKQTVTSSGKAETPVTVAGSAKVSEKLPTSAASVDESVAAQQLVSLQSITQDLPSGLNPSVLEASATLLSLHMAPVPTKKEENVEKGEVAEKGSQKMEKKDEIEASKQSKEEKREDTVVKDNEKNTGSNKMNEENEEFIDVTKLGDSDGDTAEKHDTAIPSTSSQASSSRPQLPSGPQAMTPSGSSPIQLIAPKAVYPKSPTVQSPMPSPIPIQPKPPSNTSSFRPLFPAPSPTSKSPAASVAFPSQTNSPTPKAVSPRPSTPLQRFNQGFRVRIQGNTVRPMESAVSCPASLANSRVASPATTLALRGRSLTPVSEPCHGKFSAVDSLFESLQLEGASAMEGGEKGDETDPLSSIIADLTDDFPDTDAFLGQKLDFDSDLLSDVLASIESDTANQSQIPTASHTQQQQQRQEMPEQTQQHVPHSEPVSVSRQELPQVSTPQQSRPGKKGKGGRGSVSSGTYQTRGISTRRVSVASYEGQLSDSESSDGLRHSKRKRKLTAVMTDDPYPPPKSETLNVPCWVKAALSLMQRVCRLKGSNRSKGENTAGSWFIDPVDVDTLPDYLEKVKRPMDFTTIKRKLESGSYRGYASWNADMQLVKQNCYAYNPPGHLIRIDCDEVFSFYDVAYAKMAERWQKTPLDVLSKLTVIQRPIGETDY